MKIIRKTLAPKQTGKRLVDSIALEKIVILDNHELVFIGTNRWVPDKSMWTVEKNLLSQNITIVFPFPDLSASICHVFVETSDSHKCFIHLTPLTSLFRRSTDELEKVLGKKNVSFIEMMIGSYNSIPIYPYE